MRLRDQDIADRLAADLLTFSENERPLLGIRPIENRQALLEQLVESIRRVKYVYTIRDMELSPLRADPSSELFDPIRAAILHYRDGRFDEACWLTFLSVHFGKHSRTHWRLARDVYGQLGSQTYWTWERVSSDPGEFRSWLARHYATLNGDDGISRHFGNHRKYESINPATARSTGAVVESYVSWVGPARCHETLLQTAQQRSGDDPRALFDNLYRSMSSVLSFGRTAKFDFLTMLGKLRLAPIEPGSPYMKGATGPLSGARLLFDGRTNSELHHAVLDQWLVQLDGSLGVGMQVLEDALCNWQKDPGQFRRFRG